MTINRAVWMGVRGRSDGTVRVYSAAYGKELALDTRGKPEKASGGKGPDAWFEYIRGCVHALREYALRREGESRGGDVPLAGFDAVLLSGVPRGLGLSSSAALEVSALLAFDASGRLGLSKIEIAELAQRVENEWIGMRRSAADPTTCAFGRAGKAILFDCGDRTSHFYDFFGDCVAVVLDTNTSLPGEEAAYNERREQSEAACKILGVSSLRDATLEMLDICHKDISEALFRRVSHVLTENMRARAAATALEYNESHLFGTLMNESHFSLRHEFGASSPELDAICAIARSHPACLGARAIGGGFGGGAVALLYATAAREFAGHVTAKYREETGKDANGYICVPTDGGNVENL
jgi:galactokinase